MAGNIEVGWAAGWYRGGLATEKVISIHYHTYVPPQKAYFIAPYTNIYNLMSHKPCMGMTAARLDRARGSSSSSKPVRDNKVKAIIRITI